MKSDVVPVVIAGGGFSGTMAAAQLARLGIASVLVERDRRAGRGLAYSTCEPLHVLNVPAERISAWGADEDLDGIGARKGEFLPRMHYGDYLERILRKAVDSGLVRVMQATATQARRLGDVWRVTLDDGAAVEAHALILAQGNQPPSPLRSAAGLPTDLFVNDPWSKHAQQRIADVAASGGDVLILGTGLTMVDTALSLQAAGHRGRIIAVSRRGQVSQSHAPQPEAPRPIDAPPRALMQLWRQLRELGGQTNWRPAFDALRPHSQALWQGFSRAEKGRFLRHTRPYWDVHRHRIAPEVAASLARMIEGGQLAILAGRIEGMSAADGELAATIRPRRESAASERRFAVAFNCTGPLGRMEETQDPLLKQMLAEKLIEADELGMGLRVDAHSRAGAALWALGPLTKGIFWEIVAVPDIRTQVAAVAQAIAQEVGQ